ncbi:hypothetical protein FHX77_001265 [Bifidobacterium commune]|uniref:Repeat domain (List_Bact_rpt) n=1 Tax=Bifidobacterium commune TaxID=1505727 RepID=A0A1C4H591_9BIFI|nr:InlB B-repeat-containing protein [Bifidobacterium commune]MBB2955832.1 hypothetical protein [Bifidobacterium commune]SCC80087.1 repeat domain (List_Bact_rpt) [Bifidobacterium commune]
MFRMRNAVAAAVAGILSLSLVDGTAFADTVEGDQGVGSDVPSLDASQLGLVPAPKGIKPAGVTESGPSVQDGGCVPFGGANMPNRIVNGDFEYPQIGTSDPVLTTIDGYWVNIDPVYGYFGTKYNRYEALPGFCRSRFGWESMETFHLPALNKNDAQRVELQSANGNQVGEIVGEEEGKGIYQDVRTVPGAIYKWRLRHSSFDQTHVDVMNVMIGPANGTLTAQNAVRVSVNGAGDEVGPVGTRIATKVATHNALTQSETYEGSYVIPAGQTVTRFSFKSVDSLSGISGNFIDDVSFSVVYPLSFDSNGGVGTTPERVGGVPNAGIGGCATHHAAGESVKLPTGAKDSDCWDSSMLTYPSPTSGKFAGQHAKFVGWSKDQHEPFLNEADAKAATINNYPMPESNATLHAVWAWSSGSVDYDGNAPDASGSVPSSGVIDTGTKYPVAGNGFTRPGHRFDGWTENPDGSGKVYQPGDPMEIKPGPVKLHAKWVATGSVSFDGNGPDVTGSVPGSGEKDAGSSFVVPENGFDRKNHRFDGWTENPDGSGKVYQPGETIPMPSEDSTLHAKWVSTGSVDYDGNGPDVTGSVPGSGVVDSGTKYPIADNGFTRPGHRFDGWTENPDGSGKVYRPGDELPMGEGPLKLHAKWVPTGTVSYDGNAPGVVGTMPPSDPIDIGSSASVPGSGFTRPGHRFDGWTLSPDGSGKVYRPGDKLPITDGSVTLHAKWVPTGSVSYDGGPGASGSVPGSGERDAGSGLPVAGNGFTRPGFRFKGWSLNADGSGKLYRPGDVIQVSDGPMVLHAVWEKDPAAKVKRSKSLSSTGAVSWIVAAVAVTALAAAICILLWRRFSVSAHAED